MFDRFWCIGVFWGGLELNALLVLTTAEEVKSWLRSFPAGKKVTGVRWHVMMIIRSRILKGMNTFKAFDGRSKREFLVEYIAPANKRSPFQDHKNFELPKTLSCSTNKCPFLFPKFSVWKTLLWRHLYLQYLSFVRTFVFVPRTKLGPALPSYIVQDKIKTEQLLEQIVWVWNVFLQIHYK